jgi:hypothetical protein
MNAASMSFGPVGVMLPGAEGAGYRALVMAIMVMR